MIVDLNKSQKNVDWDVLAPLLDFVPIKASGLYANQGDPLYSQHVAGAVSHGVTFHAFHFLYCQNEAEARRDAGLFFRIVKGAGHWPYVWVLDCERGWGIPNNRARPVAEEFERELRRLAAADGLGEIRVAVYIGHNCYADYALDYDHYYYRWVPRYGANDGTLEAAIVPDHPHDLWQYTSHGRVPGIVGDVDISVLSGTLPLEHFTGKRTPTEERSEQMSAADRLIEIAEAELGYLEKKSNKDLDDKTANAGNKNYTKYNRDLLAWAGVGKVNEQWCQAFVDWCFIKAFGLDDAKKLIYTFTNYTPTGSNAFKKRDRYIARGKGTPKPGDVVYFFSKSKGRIGHVGIVYKVTSSKVYTIEGNTSTGETLIENGGGVWQKSYSLKSTYIDGYGSVDYAPVERPVKLGDRDLKKGCKGDDVRELQTDLVKLGYKLPKYGADGDFGGETEKAVKAFQTASALKADGIMEADDYAAMFAALEGGGAPAPAPTPTPVTRSVEITGGSVNVRAGAGATAKHIGYAFRGERYPYGGQTQKVDGRDWLRIDYHGAVGWVSSKYARLL